MYCIGNILFLVILVAVPHYGSFLLVTREYEKAQNATSAQTNKSTLAVKHSTNPKPVDLDMTLDDAQESANFFTSDLGAPFDSQDDYGALFDNFPSLPYFPDFGEIFRISRTTTPEPPFHFPDYVSDVFPDRPKKVSKPSSDKASASYSDSAGGGRRPPRRPPRPASSGTRTKISKQNQNESKEKSKSAKSKQPPGKSRDFPKIFKFTADRVNLAEFDMKKKMNENYLTLAKGDDLDSDRVKRNKFLILHGGVFEIERPGRSGLYYASSNKKSQVTPVDNDYTYNARAESGNIDLQRLPYYYKT